MFFLFWLCVVVGLIVKILDVKNMVDVYGVFYDFICLIVVKVFIFKFFIFGVFILYLNVDYI